MLPNDETLRAILGDAKNIAVVGAKDTPGQPVNTVGRYLLAQGYTLFPVHPARAEVWGLKAYKSILDLPEKMDIIDLFRAAAYCPVHAREVLALPEKPRVFWMQLGIVSEEAVSLLQPMDIPVVQDACLKIEHKRLFSD